MDAFAFSLCASTEWKADILHVTPHCGMAIQSYLCEHALQWSAYNASGDADVSNSDTDLFFPQNSSNNVAYFQS